MRVAAVQMCSTPDKQGNLDRAGQLVAGAADAGAQLVALPELFNLWGSARELRDAAEPLDGPSITWARETATAHGITLLAGSVVERSTRDGEHLHNTSCLIDPTGTIIGTYRKIHLFDVDVPGAVHRESATITAGNEIVVVDAAPLRVGMATCYDLRFPELFRMMLDGGAEFFLVCSAWPLVRLEHWLLLNRSRALENFAFLVSANSTGMSEGTQMGGHGMIVGPTGKVVASGTEEEGIVWGEIDRESVLEARATFPALRDRVYRS